MLDQQTPTPNASNASVEPALPPVRRRIGQWAVVVVLGIAILMVTSPRSVPSLLLIVGFIALGAVLLGLVQIGLLISGLAERLSRSARRSVLMIGVLLPVLLIVMQSIGQLSVRDVLTLGSLFAVGMFYVTRARRS